jgi:hypothetical protein
MKIALSEFIWGWGWAGMTPAHQAVNTWTIGQYFMYFSSTGVWTRGPCMLNRGSATWRTPPALFDLLIFQIGSCGFAQGWMAPWSFYLYLPCSWDCSWVSPHPTFCSDEVSLTFCSRWPQTAILISASRVGGVTDMYHHAWCLLGCL